MIKLAAAGLLTGAAMTTAAQGTVESYQHQLRGSIKKGDVLIVKDEKFQHPSYNWATIQNRSVNNIITFGLFQDTTLTIRKKFSCEITLKVEYWSQPDQRKPIIINPVKLTIQYDTTAGAVYQANAVYNFKNAHKCRITVDKIQSKEYGDKLPAFFTLTAQVIADRKYLPAEKKQAPVLQASEISGNTTSGDIVTARTFTQTSYEVGLAWDKITGAEEYDLEWTFIDETSDNGRLIAQATQPLATNVLEKLFRNNASRVTIQQEYYNISLVHNSKYLLVRLRDVHYDPDGYRATSAWSYQLDGQSQSGVITLNNEWHQPNLNWQYGATYAEEGKKQEVVSYFDGSLNGRQTVTVNNTDNKAIVQQGVRDEFGRVIANVLPAPIDNHILTWYGNINKAAGNTTYNRQQVYNAGPGDCIVKPQPMSTASGAGAYYSPANPLLGNRVFNAYIPDAGGYPFDVIYYTPDNTGRVRLQGGLGPDLQPDADVNKDHATRYYYGRPYQWELDRLFGNDAGDARHYLKTMTVDPNQQVSILYQHPSGATVASALAGNPPPATEALPGVPVQKKETFAILQPESFVFDRTTLKLTGTTTYLVAITGKANLAYQVEKLIRRYEEKGVTICSNCYYALRISIYDDCKELVYANTEPVQIGAVASDCKAGGWQQQSIEVDFKRKGSYYITFELALDPNVIVRYTEDFVARNTNLRRQFNFILDELQRTDFTGCFGECTTCKQSLGSREYFMGRLSEQLTKNGAEIYQAGSAFDTWAYGLYNTLQNQCMALQQSCLASPCDTYEQQMKGDVSPGGQYALFDAMGQPLEQEINVLYLHWREVFPEAAPGSAAYDAESFTLPDGSITSPYAGHFSLHMLVKYWNPDWAVKFLPWHPEKCALDFCRTNSAHAQWDERIKTFVNTVHDISTIRVDLEYDRDNAVWLLMADPFFASGAPGFRWLHEFKNDLENYSTRVLKLTDSRATPKSLTGYVDYSLYCMDRTGNTSTITDAPWNNCQPVATCRIPDREWHLYRQLYFELKEKYYQLARDSGNCKNMCRVGAPYGVGGTTGYSMPPPVTPTPPSEVETFCNNVSSADFQITRTVSTATDDVYDIKYVPVATKPIPDGVTVIAHFVIDYYDGTETRTDLGFDKDILTRNYGVYHPDRPIAATFIQAAWCENTQPPSDNFCSTLTAADFKFTNNGRLNGVWRFQLEYISSATKPIPAGQRVQTASLITFSDGTMHYTEPVFTKDSLVIHFTLYRQETVLNVASHEITGIVCPDAGGSSCPPALATKTPRFTNIDREHTLGADSLQNDGRTQLNQQILTACEGIADNFLQQLEPCLRTYYNDDYANKKALLKTGLMSVCMFGGDSAHVFGASTTPPGITTAQGYTSFADVLRGVLGISSFTMECNPWLPDAPYPYNVQGQAADQFLQATNSQFCEKLAALKKEHIRSRPAISFYQYLTTTYGAAMKLTEAELGMLDKSCTNCRFLLPKELPLPVFLEAGATGCLLPARFLEGWNAMQSTAFNSPNPAHPNYERIVTNFLNQRWGFSLSYSAYKEYYDFLQANTGTRQVLCNQPVYSTTTVDPYSCLLEMLDGAVAAGRRRYDVYIDSVKQDFRKNYVSFCVANKTTVSLEANEQLYHYTLYYYDQAGNLLRTIPPEGVTLLDAAAVAAVDRARQMPNLECTYNGPLNNTDKQQALQRLSTTLGQANQSIEMWLYNSSGTSQQVLTTTGGQQYLFQVCIDGRYLHADIYTLQEISPGILGFKVSNHAAADLNNLLPLKSWTHVVLQGSKLDNQAIDVYVNGVLCAAANSAPAGACNWQVQVINTNVQIPENLSALKHLRLYNRLMTTAEIAANAQEVCMGISPAYYTGLQASLREWARFNMPPADPNAPPGDAGIEKREPLIFPLHRMATSYAYTSLNQVTQQQTPDAGDSRFWYDRQGRLIASQNAEQASPVNGGGVGRYSYTLYDAIGRITETGEKSNINALSSEPPGFLEMGAVNAFQIGGTNTQITQTLYDVAYPAGGTALFAQEHLRKRISAVWYRENTTATPSQATYYSYDLIGNVKTLWQQLEGLGTKQLNYQYDLVSGKVNKVRYQPSQPDQFFYGYSYDANNRITKAMSGIRSVSVDGWEIENPVTDAYYQYYLHGPLARTEIGQYTVQGIDYVYTLQGWLKGMNSHYLQPAGDIGKDGNSGSPAFPVGRDALAFTLDYFNNDYKPVGSAATSAFPLQWQAQAGDITGHSLYNGNISRSTLALSALNNGAPTGYSYRYDQLNRLVRMRQHTLMPGATTWGAAQITNAYQEDITYDGNGNILQYDRNGTAAQPNMDALRYAYPHDAQGKLISNRLRHIKDNPSISGNYPTDIDEQPDNNYSYDNIGNLIADNRGDISKIEWTMYGKIRRIAKTDGSSLEYKYDASGNRVYKQYKQADQTTHKTWYVRDAQGSVLAVYGNKNGDGLMYWKEQHLYGGNRLGQWLPDMNMASPNSATLWSQQGLKRYELVNHLDNVLAVVTDKKLAVDADNNGQADYYTAEVASAQDYYPFGMLQPGRQFTLGNAYRYGFNGKENDNEVKGEGNQQDYGMRVYDPRAGRFLSIDPLTKQYPELTPYQFASNRPIDGVDLDGLEYVTRRHIVDKNGVIIATKDKVYYTMSEHELKAHGGTPAGAFNSAGYGPGGKGIKHEYYYEDGTPSGREPLWNLPQHSIMGELSNHGIYSGSGSITYYGEKSYDFTWQPIDEADAIAKRHDMGYAKVGAFDVVEDTRTLGADEQMVKEVSQYLKSVPMKLITHKRVAGETVAAAISQKKFIGILADYKKWKIRFMTKRGLNPNNVEDMQKVTLDNKRIRLAYVYSLMGSTARKKLLNLGALLAAKSETKKKTPEQKKEE